jgi:hypothetical protein
VPVDSDFELPEFAVDDGSTLASPESPVSPDVAVGLALELPDCAEPVAVELD